MNAKPIRNASILRAAATLFAALATAWLPASALELTPLAGAAAASTHGAPSARDMLNRQLAEP
ncbi:MAG: hypothetical protein JNJ55_10210, partial [Betaproteobacteria bacterium]|nr:hypothetical protein [Betaproteobacteria bacterium]